MKRMVTRGVFGAALLGALGFGVAQAVAAPAAGAQGAARCIQETCDRKCAQEGLIGFCDGRGCVCR